MSLFFVLLAYHPVDCSERTGSKVKGGERAEVRGRLRHPDLVPGKVLRRSPAKYSAFVCQEDGVNWVGGCGRELTLALADGLTKCFGVELHSLSSGVCLCVRVIATTIL